MFHVSCSRVCDLTLWNVFWRLDTTPPVVDISSVGLTSGDIESALSNPVVFTILVSDVGGSGLNTLDVLTSLEVPVTVDGTLCDSLPLVCHVSAGPSPIAGGYSLSVSVLVDGELQVKVVSGA